MKNPTPSHLAYHSLFYLSLATFTVYFVLFVTKGEPFQDTFYNYLFRNETEAWIGFLLSPTIYMFSLHFLKRSQE